MANNLDEEQKRLQERRELLKLKQGIIEESELIPQDGYVELPKLHGLKKIENFFYHYKWIIVVIAVAALIVGYMIYQSVSDEKNDLYVLAISTTNESGLYTKMTDIENTLEKYCPDFDGNGYVHVGVNFITLSTETGYSEYTDLMMQKFQAELFTGDSQIYLTDTGIVELINSISDDDIHFFVDFSEEYPDAVLYDGCGLQLNTTDFNTEARWESCPDIVGLYVRDEFDNMTGNDKDAQEQRERALIVFRNIIEGNVVNPSED